MARCKNGLIDTDEMDRPGSALDDREQLAKALRTVTLDGVLTLFDSIFGEDAKRADDNDVKGSASVGRGAGSRFIPSPKVALLGPFLSARLSMRKRPPTRSVGRDKP